MISSFLDYLVHGSTELTLPKSWLADRERLSAYEAYTRAQLDQGSVVSDVAAMRRQAFWKAVEAKRSRKSADVLRMARKQA